MTFEVIPFVLLGVLLLLWAFSLYCVVRSIVLKKQSNRHRAEEKKQREENR